MLKIIWENEKEEREKLNALCKEKNGYVPQLFEREYWLKIEVTDVTAAHFLFTMMYHSENIEGFDKLGFKIHELAWAGVGKTDEIKQKLHEFVDTL